MTITIALDEEIRVPRTVIIGTGNRAFCSVYFGDVQLQFFGFGDEQAAAIRKAGRELLTAAHQLELAACEPAPSNEAPPVEAVPVEAA